LPISAPELLNASHDLSQFSCGKASLDIWLKTRARSNHDKGFTVVRVVHELGRVVGYHGIAPTAVVPNSLPRAIRTGQPPDPVPCLLVGQIAVDSNWAGRGIGSGLLKDALSRCLQGAALIGGRAVVVKAVDEDALDYWKRRGFVPSNDDPFTLYRSIEAIAASLRQAANL
jgi:GNAT superfamily N-acetyltransferase